MNASASLKERVLATAASTPSPTRRQGNRLGTRLLALSLVTALGLFELAGGIAHGRDRPLAVTVRMADGWALASTVLTWLLLRRREMLVSFPRLLLVATLVCPVALFVWMAHFEGAFPPLPGSLPSSDWACLAFTLAGAATPLGCFLRLHRGIELQRPICSEPQREPRPARGRASSRSSGAPRQARGTYCSGTSRPSRC